MSKTLVILMIGKMGTGKRALGDALVSADCFYQEFVSGEVRSERNFVHLRTCEWNDGHGVEHKGSIYDRVTIIDTHGFHESWGGEKEFSQNLRKLIEKLPRVDLLILTIKKDD